MPSSPAAQCAVAVVSLYLALAVTDLLLKGQIGIFFFLFYIFKFVINQGSSCKMHLTVEIKDGKKTTHKTTKKNPTNQVQSTRMLMPAISNKFTA